jgi:hypothetical protein
MLPTRRIRDEILKSLIRGKYDFGDGKDMRETTFEKDRRKKRICYKL